MVCLINLKLEKKNFIQFLILMNISFNFNFFNFHLMIWYKCLHVLFSILEVILQDFEIKFINVLQSYFEP